MTRQTWTAVVSSLVFIALAAVIAFAPIPFVAWTPGVTYDVLGASNGKPIINARRRFQATTPQHGK